MNLKYEDVLELLAKWNKDVWKNAVVVKFIQWLYASGYKVVKK